MKGREWNETKRHSVLSFNLISTHHPFWTKMYRNFSSFRQYSAYSSETLLCLAKCQGDKQYRTKNFIQICLILINCMTINFGFVQTPVWKSNFALFKSKSKSKSKSDTANISYDSYSFSAASVTNRQVLRCWTPWGWLCAESCVLECRTALQPMAQSEDKKCK